MSPDYGENITAAVAAQLRALRVDQGLTLAEVADLAGVHASTVHLIEHGKRGLTVGTAARLARALDVHLSDLLEDAEDTYG